MANYDPQQYLKRNRAFFEDKWRDVIRKQLEEWSKIGIQLRKNAKEDIWTAYCAFNEHCSVNYLGGADSTLDRHKVAACYLCAVLAVRPLRVPSSIGPDSDAHFANEYAAVHVACSILAGFTLAAIDESELCERDKEHARSSVLSGLKFEVSFPAGHETYLIGLVKALRFTAAERRYNLLLTSLLMYHWEMALVGNLDFFEKIISTRGIVDSKKLQ